MNAQLVPGVVRAATGHMPFKGHRTQQEVREDAKRYDQLPWCPSEYRPLYLRLRRKGFSAIEARPLVEAHIEIEIRRSSSVPVVAKQKP